MTGQRAVSHRGRVKAELMFRIGEFARFTRVSVKMLRHYDEIGLLPPARIDLATGYRYYRAAQLPRLNRIILLRDLGFGLEEIKTIVDPADDADEPLDAAYERRERELIETLHRTASQLAAVRARRAMLREPGDEHPVDVVLRPVPALLVATLRGDPGTDVGELFVRTEEYVQSHRARAVAPPLTLLDTDSVTVAVPLTWPIPDSAGVVTHTLPAVPRLACTVHNGTYAGLTGRLQQMLRWLEHTGRRPNGPVREVYLRFGAEPELTLPPGFLTTQAAELVTELQVPVN